MIEAIEKAKQHFGKLLEEQLERIEHMKKGEDWIDYSMLKPIIIGFISGDGIGPYITKEAKRVLEFLLKDELAISATSKATSYPFFWQYLHNFSFCFSK